MCLIAPSCQERFPHERFADSSVFLCDYITRNYSRTTFIGHQPLRWNGISHNSQTMNCVIWIGWRIDKVRKCLHSALFYIKSLIFNRFRRVDTSTQYLNCVCTMPALFWAGGQSVLCFGYSCYGDEKFLFLRQKILAPITVVALWQNRCVQTIVQINDDGVYTLLYIDFQLFILWKCRV